MSNTKKKNFYIGIKIIGSQTNHITIAFLGDYFNLQDVEFYLEKNTLPDEVRVKIRKIYYFGPKNDIPVWVLSFENKEKEIYFIDIWKKFNIEQEYTKKLERLNWHTKITSSSPDWKIGTFLELGQIYVKEIN